jgi:hypothetical protein
LAANANTSLLRICGILCGRRWRGWTDQADSVGNHTRSRETARNKANHAPARSPWYLIAFILDRGKNLRDFHGTGQKVVSAIRRNGRMGTLPRIGGAAGGGGGANIIPLKAARGKATSKM